MRTLFPAAALTVFLMQPLHAQTPELDVIYSRAYFAFSAIGTFHDVTIWTGHNLGSDDWVAQMYVEAITLDWTSEGAEAGYLVHGLVRERDMSSVSFPGIVIKLVDEGTDWEDIPEWVSAPVPEFWAPTILEGGIAFPFFGSVTLEPGFEPVERTVYGTPSTAPEPISLLLLGTGLAGVGVIGRRRRIRH